MRLTFDEVTCLPRKLPKDELISSARDIAPTPVQHRLHTLLTTYLVGSHHKLLLTSNLSTSQAARRLACGIVHASYETYLR